MLLGAYKPGLRARMDSGTRPTYFFRKAKQQGSLLIPKMEFFYKSSYLRFDFFISGLEGLEGVKKLEGLEGAW